MRAILTLDIGGSAVKHALFAPDGVQAEGFAGKFSVDESADANAVKGVLCGGVERLCELARARGISISRVGVSIPGPFDYRGGVFLMRHKFAALHGQSLADILHMVLPGADFVYLHDSAAFLLGEAHGGSAKGAVSPMGVTLGTGIGVACMRAGRVLLTEEWLPVLSLWSKPFGGATVEDALSSRGIRDRYAKIAAGSARIDVIDIARLARGGDSVARQTMRETGQVLGRVIARFAPTGYDRVIIGGQIAKAADLFLPAAREESPVEIVAAAHPDNAALCGLYRYASLGPEGTIQTGESILP